MPFFEHDSLRFHYRDEGSGGVAFVFQHGLGADLTQPFSLFRPPSGIRLIAFDCRAHGETSVGDQSLITLATFADDLRALLTHLGIAQAVVGGISMGAAVALNLTLRFPNRVRGLVLSRPAWTDRPHPWNVHMFSLIAGLVRDHGPKRGQELFRETPDYAEALAKWPDVASSLASQFEHPRVAETAFKLEQIIHDSPCSDLKELAAIKVPTLVLANDLDPIHPLEFGHLLAEAIPGAAFQQITSKSISVEKHERDVQVALERFFQKNFRLNLC